MVKGVVKGDPGFLGNEAGWPRAPLKWTYGKNRKDKRMAKDRERIIE